MRSCSVSTSVGVDDLRVDRDRDHLTAALHGDLHQPAAGLAVHLGIGQRFLRLHQLLLHLLRLREESRHVGRASGLHDSPLAYWSRLGCARPQRRFGAFSLVGRRATVAPVPASPACRRRARPPRWRHLLVAASTLASPASAAPANIAGMIVFLDPGHNGANDASISRQVPTGRGGTKDCQASGTVDRRRLSGAHLHLGHRAAHPPGADRAGRAHRDVARRRHRPRPVRRRTRRAWPTRCSPNAIVSIHADGGPPTGRGFHVNYSSPPLNQAQAGPSVQFAQIMRDQLQASGFVPATYIGSGRPVPALRPRRAQPGAVPVDPRRTAAT